MRVGRVVTQAQAVRAVPEQPAPPRVHLYIPIGYYSLPTYYTQTSASTQKSTNIQR